MLRMPPLRERRDDIPLLIEHFLRRLAAAYQRPPVSVTPAALDRIMQLPWPGNVRQLEHFVEQAFVLSEGDVLTERDFFGDSDAAPERSATRSSGPPTSGAPLGSRVPPQDGPDVGLTLWEVERRHILSTLEAVRGSRTEAARRLGISVRTLQYRLKEYRETGSASRGKVVPLPPPASRRL
jgi:DNA-binding NtrC family response regulator